MPDDAKPAPTPAPTPTPAAKDTPTKDTPTKDASAKDASAKDAASAKSVEDTDKDRKDQQSASNKDTAIEHPPASAAMDRMGATTTLATHSVPADREETKEEASGEKVPGAFEKKETKVHITPSPFSPNEERVLFSEDPDKYQKQKLAGTTSEALSDEDLALLNGPGTHTTEPREGVRASNEDRAKEEEKSSKEAENRNDKYRDSAKDVNQGNTGRENKFSSVHDRQLPEHDRSFEGSVGAPNDQDPIKTYPDRRTEEMKRAENK